MSTSASKRSDAALGSDRGEVLEQHRAQPATLLGVVYEKRHLGRGGPGDLVVAPDGQHLVTEHGDQRDAFPMVDVGEPLHLGRVTAGDAGRRNRKRIVSGDSREWKATSRSASRAGSGADAACRRR